MNDEYAYDLICLIKELVDKVDKISWGCSTDTEGLEDRLDKLIEVLQNKPN